MKNQAFNPYLPSWEYIPDGEPYVFGDRVYVYGSMTCTTGYVFCMGDYVCWSAPVDDLSDWRYEGVIFPKTADPFNTDGQMNLFAPDVTQGPDGRYYLYYVLDKIDVVSVAVCDTPAGRYQFLGYVQYADGTLLGRRAGDEPQFDPGVLTEGETTLSVHGVFLGVGQEPSRRDGYGAWPGHADDYSGSRVRGTGRRVCAGAPALPSIRFLRHRPSARWGASITLFTHLPRCTNCVMP